MGHIQQFQPMAPWLLIMLFFVSCFSTVGVIRQKRTVSWLGSSGGLKIRRSSFNSNTVHLCAGSGDRNGLQNHSGWFESICALAAWCNGSTQDLGSCDIGSNPMAAASHSSKGKDRGFLSGRSGFESPQERPARPVNSRFLSLRASFCTLIFSLRSETGFAQGQG